MWSLLAWVGFALVLWFGWTAFALLRAAPRERLPLLWRVGLWQAVSAVAALLVWRAGLRESFGIFSILGLIIVATNPVFWGLGQVRTRLQRHGVRVNELLRLRGPR